MDVKIEEVKRTIVVVSMHPQEAALVLQDMLRVSIITSLPYDQMRGQLRKELAALEAVQK